MELRPTEHYIKENVFANLFRGIEGVGGKIHITNERIFFQPHGLNIQSSPLEISFQDIVTIEKRNSAFIIPNGMKIVVNGGQEYKFVVYKREQLIALLRDTKDKFLR